ncbi:MAG: general L-amino acid transport system permease protein [Verrucomicrobiales bacterium]|jgi:general L-amino acid transport system permease protein
MTEASNYLPAADSIAAAVNETSRAPSQKLPPGEWMKKNLFSDLRNSIVTVIVGVIAFIGLYFGAGWIIDSDFQIVRTNLRSFMIGQFPRDELWRPWASGYVLLLAVGLTSGALARDGHDLAVSQELPTEKESLGSLARRFWGIIAVTIFFVSFARSIMPFIGLAAAAVLLVAARELGWQLPPTIRRSATFIGASLLVVSTLILAGTSQLGGVVLGIITFLWVLREVGRRDLPPGAAGGAMRFGPALIAAVVVYAIQLAIPHEGFGWEEWGGLHITLFTTVVGITLGMPFGILLALGRRSDLPVLKTASVLFIEFVRGVPLIALLLASGLLLPLFLPVDFDRPADLTLAIVVITGFSAAYIAEIVRGGLQAVPKGQTEAAQAAGMSAASVQRLIVLPQALRAVIPAMVGQFIALFKDTSLLSIIGILEFLRVSDTSNAQPDFVGKGLSGVTYLFVAIGYWAFAYTLSKESRRLELKLGVGTR